MNRQLELGLKISGDGSSARREVEGVRESIGGISSMARQASADVASHFGTMTAAFVSANLAMKALEIGAKTLGGAFSQIAKLESLADMAETTGIAVESLSALARVARIGGNDISLVETAAVRLSKALSGADDEAKGAAHALDTLGLSQRQLQQMDTAAAMKLVADRLNDYASGAGKVALVMDLFGRSGAQLLPLLRDLAEEHALVGKVTTAQAEEARRYEENMRKLEASAGQLAKTLAVTLLPALTSATEGLLKFTKPGSGSEEVHIVWFEKALNSVAQAIEELIIKTEGARGRILSLLGADKLAAQSGAEMARAKANLADLVFQRQQLDAYSIPADAFGTGDVFKKSLAGYKSNNGAPAAVSDAVKAYDALMKSIREKIALDEAELANGEKLTESRKLQVELTARMAELLGKITPQAREQLQIAIDRVVGLKAEIEERDKLDKLIYGADARRVSAIDTLAKEATALEEETRKIRDQNVELVSGKEALEAIKVARLEDAIASEQRRLALIDETSAEAEGIRRVIDALKDRQVALGQQLVAQKLHEQQQEWKRFSEEIEQSLTDALMRGFESGKGFGQSFVDSLKHTLETAALKIVVQAIVSPVMSAAGSALGIAGAAGSSGNLLSGISGLSNLSGGGLYGSFATSSLGSSLGLSTPFIDALGSGVGAGGTALTGLGAALPWIGGALAIGGAFGLFDGDGAAQRTTPYRSALAKSGSGYPWEGNQWFSGDMYAAQHAFDVQLQAQEQSIIDKLKLSDAQVTAVNARLSSLGGKTYGAGMEGTDIASSGVFQAISSDRLSAIAAALGMSLQDLTYQISDAAAAAKSANLAASLNGLAGTLKALDSVQGLRATLGQSIAQVRGTWTYDAQMADLRARLSGADELATQVDLAGKIKDLVFSRYQSESAAIEATKTKALEAQETLRSALREVGDYAKSLSLSDLSPLTNAQRLAEASGQFDALSGQSRAGDVGALGKISGAADAYLREARSYYASGSAYSAIFSTVQGSLAALGLSAGSVADTTDWQGQLLKVQDEAVSQLSTLVGATDEWTSTLETNLAQQVSALTALNLTEQEIAANTKDLDRRIGVLVSAAVGLAFDKLQAAIEKSAAANTRAITAAVQSVVRA